MKKTKPSRHGWVLFKWTCVFAVIQFTKHFIEFVLVETNQLFVRNSKASWRGKPAAIARAGLLEANAECYFFPVRISKCRGYDLGLCMTSVLSKRMRLHSADFRWILRPNTFLNRKSALCSCILSASTEVMYTPRSDSALPWHFDIKNTYQICMQK